MAMLPGWDRGRLAIAPEGDIAAARWLVYGRARAPEIQRDLASSIRSLEIDKMSAAERKVQTARDRDRSITQLREALKSQAALRAVMELDVDDAEEPG